MALVALVAVSPVPGRAEEAPPPPPEWLALYLEADEDLTNLNAEIDAEWDGSRPPVVFSAESFFGTSNLGAALATDEVFDRAVLEVDRFQELGLEAVTLSIHFPWLYEPFYEDSVAFLQIADFYRRLGEEIHSRGMKVIVENQVAFPDDPLLQLDFFQFFNSLTWNQYVLARAATAETIVATLDPEYLTVLSEPDTEADLSGKEEAETVEGATFLTKTIAGQLRSSGYEGRIGAGFGTWYRYYKALTVSLCADTEIDYVNLHLYPINLDFTDRLLEVADIAHAFGKKTSLGEGWLYKISESEYGKRLTPFEIFARDPYSFWAPLDQKFLDLFVKLAFFTEMEFASPFWSRFFYSYIEYNQFTKDQPQGIIQALSFLAAIRGLDEGSFTSTGLHYRDLVNPPAEATLQPRRPRRNRAAR